MPVDEIENFILGGGTKLDVRHEEGAFTFECHCIKRSYRDGRGWQSQDQIAAQQRGLEDGHEL
jgi:hypothetical protein